MHSYFNYLVSLNLVICSTGMMIIEIFMLANYSWSTNYFYAIMAALVFSVATIVVVAVEQTVSKKTRTFDTTEPSTQTLPKMDNEASAQKLQSIDLSFD